MHDHLERSHDDDVDDDLGRGGVVALLVLVRDRSGPDPEQHVLPMSVAAVIGPDTGATTLFVLGPAIVVFLALWQDHGLYRFRTLPWIVGPAFFAALLLARSLVA